MAIVELYYRPKAASRDQQLMAVSLRSVPTKNQHTFRVAWVREYF